MTWTAPRWVALAIVAAALTTAIAQLPNINRPKLPTINVPGVPGLDRLMKEDPPITTSLSDALTEVPFLDDYNPPSAIRLSILPRSETGAFDVFPGDFTFEAQSYCLHAGTHGPGRGEGYLYAPLKGPKQEIIRGILQRSVAQPDLPQQQVQVLIWSILARTKPSQLNGDIRQTAGKLLTEKELASLEGSGWDMLKEQVSTGGPSIFGSLPGPVRQLMEAENRLRGMMYQANAPFAELENIAVLGGEYKKQKGDREVPRGRWSWHPDGYFVRYFPHGYSHTTQELYFPASFTVELGSNGALSLVKDASGRAIRVEGGDAAYLEGDKELAKAKLSIDKGTSDRRRSDFEKILGKLKLPKEGAKKLGAIADVVHGLGTDPMNDDAREFAYHAWMSTFAETAKAGTAPLYALIGAPALETAAYDPSKTVATPGETGRQRLAQSGRCKPEDGQSTEESEFQKAVVDAMRKKGYTVGPENVLVYDQRDRGNLLRFAVRMRDGKPLPTMDCINEMIGRGEVPPGSLPSASEILFGSVQFAGSKQRVGVRTVRVETGEITGAGKGDGNNFAESAEAAFENYQRRPGYSSGSTQMFRYLTGQP